MQRNLDEAREATATYARELVGDDDVAFVQLFTALLNIAERVSLAPEGQAGQEALAVLARVSGGRRVAVSGTRARSRDRKVPDLANTINADPILVRNAQSLIADRTRILGGEPIRDFPDCVAVGALDTWCCTGTLVAPTLVVTAAHCAPECVSRVFFGSSVDHPEDGRVVNVQAAHVREDYDPQTYHNDLTVLVLDEPITDVPPRGIAASADLADAQTVRLVGFGTTNPEATEGLGVKRAVDVPLAPSKPEWGVSEDIEFAAGAPLLDKDSCRGDSGGPAYVAKGSEWLLAGATSRATQIVDEVRLCGDGGIYTRAHAFQDWIFGFAD